MHLESSLRLDVFGQVLALLSSKALVSLLIGLFELQVRRRPGSCQNSNPVLQEIPLRERPVAILFLELVGIEILSRRLAAAHEEEVVRPQRSGIRKRESGVNHHCKRDSPLVDGLAERDVLSCAVQEDMRQ